VGYGGSSRRAVARDHETPRLALVARLFPDLGGDHRHDADNLRLRCQPVWIEAVGRLGGVVMHASRLRQRRCSTFSAALNRLQPGWDPRRMASAGLIITFPSGSTALVFRSLRMGELAMVRTMWLTFVIRQDRHPRARVSRRGFLQGL